MTIYRSAPFNGRWRNSLKRSERRDCTFPTFSAAFVGMQNGYASSSIHSTVVTLWVPCCFGSPLGRERKPHSKRGHGISGPRMYMGRANEKRNVLYNREATSSLTANND